MKADGGEHAAAGERAVETPVSRAAGEELRRAIALHEHAHGFDRAELAVAHAAPQLERVVAEAVLRDRAGDDTRTRGRDFDRIDARRIDVERLLHDRVQPRIDRPQRVPRMQAGGRANGDERVLRQRIVERAEGRHSELRRRAFRGLEVLVVHPAQLDRRNAQRRARVTHTGAAGAENDHSGAPAHAQSSRAETW